MGAVDADSGGQGGGSATALRLRVPVGQHAAMDQAAPGSSYSAPPAGGGVEDEDMELTQIQTRTISAAEAGAAVAAASEAVGLSERLRLWKELDAVRTTCRQTHTQVRGDGRETYRAWW